MGSLLTIDLKYRQSQNFQGFESGDLGSKAIVNRPLARDVTPSSGARSGAQIQSDKPMILKHKINKNIF